MARSGDTDLEFNERFFETVLRQPKVEAIVDQAAERGMANMQANAPVDLGEYRDGFHIEHRDSRYRRVTRVVNDDPKTMIIESKQGVMVRGLKAAKQ